MMLLVCVGYSALYKPVQCVVKFLHCGSLDKGIFKKNSRDSKAKGFVILSVFALRGSLEKSIFQELLETQTIGFIMLVM